jgi:MoaA/NifB/PqqE/SkfB family radical SAM enzyme
MAREPRILFCEQDYSLAKIGSRIREGLSRGAMLRQVRGQLVNGFLTLRKAHKSHLTSSLMIINIELTNHCNHKCKFCSTGLNTNIRKKGKMDFETFKLIAQQISPGTTVVIAGFGEPFLNTELELFLEYAHTFGVTSNLQLLSNFGAISEKRIRRLLDYPFKRLVVSLDSMSRETFIEYRGCDDFDNVLNNITILSDEMKKRKTITQEIMIQMVVTKKNIHEKELFIDYAKRMNFIPRLKQLNTHNSFARELEINEFEVPELSRYSDLSYSRSCMWAWGGMMVLWNGDVTICCQDPQGIEVHGNIRSDSIFNLLNKSTLRCDFRQKYFDDPGQIEICRRCDVA